MPDDVHTEFTGLGRSHQRQKMEIILIIAAIGFAIWFFASGTFQNSFQSTDAMSQDALSSAFIETKKKILVTSAYDKEYEYKKLYARMHELMARIIEHHERYILDFEAKGNNDRFAPQQYNHFDSSGLTRGSNRIPHDIEPSNYSDEQLIYWCIFLWHGGSIKGVGEIDADPKLMLKILAYLIDKNNADAMFLRGMTLKYGATVYSESFPRESKKLLEAAHSKGVGAAAVELRDIEKYNQLEGIKSVQLGAIS